MGERTNKQVIDTFADVKIMRYQVPGFEELSLKKKTLIYFLSQAALEGRDIIFDQNNKYNLRIRRTLEAILLSESFDGNTENGAALETYLKRIWFSNGIHHHYSMDKFEPGFTLDYFREAVKRVDVKDLPLGEEETLAEFLQDIEPLIFDKTLYAKRVNQLAGEDLIASSANNYYGEGISQAEVEAYYQQFASHEAQPVSWGLNSRLEREDDALVERVWKVNGLYGAAITKIVYWLEQALTVCENENQEKALNLLITYYKTGDLHTFDEYSIAWLNDQNSHIDFVNGFIETYGDALGLKASWESIVNFKDVKASERTAIISQNAQWFEDHSPVDPHYKKTKVKGVSAKVITAAMLGGDCYPATPIGVNLPNSDWIRKEHGSKSVTIENITQAYHLASKGNGFIEEFAFDQSEIERHNTYGFITDNLHTDLHECLGHGSGQLAKGIKGDELKAYGATIEEARADLFGLYYMADPKLVELGLLPHADAFKTAYDSYIRNGLLTQLTRINLGDDVIESHMRNRKLIAEWCFKHGAKDGVIEARVKDGKTYFVVTDYQKMRNLIADLLCEVQRIKSEGDINAAKALVENYAVKINYDLHKEILERFESLELAPYGGFVNPVYEPIWEHGKIVDVKISYSESYRDQMLRYSKCHSYLPHIN